MENTLILCGGTGAHTAVAFIRLHILGHALGFFDQDGKPFDFPTLYLVDQDAGDGAERPTAWQLARALVTEHPARRSWSHAIGRPEAPELISVTPLPVGKNQAWFQRPNNTLETRFESSELPPILHSRFQRGIDFSKGMMGSPALGSLLFRLKQYDERSKGLNYDETYGQMLKSEGRVVVAASGVGGTGASVAPTVAEQLAAIDTGRVMAVMILNWFEFVLDGTDEVTRAKAQQRNRLMRENAHSALEFYGKRLAQRVAAVPVGMPDRALIKRDFTGDVGQPIRESFIHAVGALCSYRHFLAEQPYAPGLYMMGAVERGRLDGATPVPGGTLQGLANQAATVSDLLETWIETLSRVHDGRVRPALYEAVAAIGANPGQVADHLRTELEHYQAHLHWLDEVVGVKPSANRSFSRETESRRRLLSHRRGLEVPAESPPEEVASALFRWTASWVRDLASPQVGLEVHPKPVGGGQWPDLRNAEGLGVAAELNGDLNRIDDANRDGVIEAFVDPASVTTNGWPHPLAAADYFRPAVQRRDRKAMRQLELLLVGVVSETLELRNVHVQEPAEADVTLDRLLREYWREGWKGLAELAVTSPAHDNRPIGFVSPYTLFAPVPFMNDDDYHLWNSLWRSLTGAGDGADWDEAPEPVTWGENELVIHQILSWMEDQKKARAGSSPPWMRVFERHRVEGGAAPYGAGRRVRVYWGAVGDAERSEVDLHLPTKDPADWVLPDDAPTLAAEELLDRMPHLLEVRDEEDRPLYSMVEIRVPDQDNPLRGFWDRHLDHLRELGEIHLWAREKNGAVVLGVMAGGNLAPIRIAESRLLSRASVAVTSCTPLEQDPIPGSSRAAGQLLYPDLPLKPDYLDLVQLPDGMNLLDALAEGKDIDFTQWRPVEKRDTDGRRQVQWELRLRGLPEPLLVDLRLNPEEKPHRAHWMVWPRFRSRRGDGWRTYYVYEQCTDKNLRLETLWLESDGNSFRVHRRHPEGDGLAYPVAYRSGGAHPAHAGGPPLALCLQHVKKEEERGIYMVPLETFSKQDTDVELAVDFGTSHSVAAFKVGNDATKPISFAAELDRGQPQKGLSLHLSENWAHVQAPATELGVLASGSWLPTYALTSQGMLPSDLIVARPLAPGQAEQIARWQPGRDYLIPPLDVGREDLSQYLLADFKWDVDNAYFRGHETELQEHYLTLFLELALGEIVAHGARGFPARSVNFIFTYPLRTPEEQVDRYQKSAQRVLQRCSAGMGLDLGLKGGVGIFDESRAARITSRNYGEVCLVGDLGGGTLDLFISAEDRISDQKVFKDVADSVRLGGNLLLHGMAEQPSTFLPANGNWHKGGDLRDTEAKLRAWMRSLGAPRLFGSDAGGKTRFEKLKVDGFARVAEADEARLLLDRYFRLVVEYMARNLTAYLVGQWFPNVKAKDYKLLRISVQLRGNGWRLRYQDESYEQATAAIQALVKERVLTLWNEIEENRYPAPTSDEFWADISRYRVDNPKTAPIINVVGKKPIRNAEVRKLGLTHTLVDLEVELETEPRLQVAWWEEVPFQTKGSKEVKVRRISPPLQLTDGRLDKKLVISTLEAARIGRINEELEHGSSIENEVMYWAPVAPFVWEAVFQSPELWPSR